MINTVSKAVPNLYERFGVQYLSVHWTEKEENVVVGLCRFLTVRATLRMRYLVLCSRRWSRARVV